MSFDISRADDERIDPEGIETHIHRLDRSPEAYSIWAFVRRIVTTPLPAGVLFLSGEPEHGPDLYACRLNEDMESILIETSKKLRDPLPDLKCVLCQSNLPRLVAANPNEWAEPFLVDALQLCARDGMEGLQPEFAGSLISAHARANEHAAKTGVRTLYIVPFVLPAPELVYQPTERVVREAEEFFAQMACTENCMAHFLFCAVVTDGERSDLNIAIEANLIQNNEIRHDPELSGICDIRFPVETRQSFWGISHWSSIKFGDVVPFLDLIQKQNRARGGHFDARAIRHEMQPFFDRGSEHPLLDVRRRLIEVIEERADG